jgi:hypothetical protein
VVGRLFGGGTTNTIVARLIGFQYHVCAFEGGSLALTGAFLSCRSAAWPLGAWRGAAAAITRLYTQQVSYFAWRVLALPHSFSFRLVKRMVTDPSARWVALCGAYRRLAKHAISAGATPVGCSTSGALPHLIVSSAAQTHHSRWQRAGPAMAAKADGLWLVLLLKTAASLCCIAENGRRKISTEEPC